MNMQKIIPRLAQLDTTISMFADGYVDEVWELVNSRISLSDYIAISQKKQLAERIMLSDTGGMAIEMIKKRRTIGGFTANIGYAAARLGLHTILVGLYGKEALDPLYEPLGRISQLISLGNPAITHALEFDDGKILLTHMESVSKLSWDDIVEAVGKEEIISILTISDIIGVGYWASMHFFDDNLAKICGLIPQDSKRRRFFFDFADVRKREETSLIATLQNFSKINKKLPITLSLNEHEGAVIFELYGETLDDKGGTIPQKMESVRRQMGIEELVVHTPYYAAASSYTEGAGFSHQKYCEKPIRTAGAGDTFNGGYLAAMSAGLNPLERLQFANATVSYFLNNGHPPSLEQLAKEKKEVVR